MVTITARNGFVSLLVQGIRADKFKHCSFHQSNQKQVNPPYNNNPWFPLRKVTVFYTYNTAKRIQGKPEKLKMLKIWSNSQKIDDNCSSEPSSKSIFGYPFVLYTPVWCHFSSQFRETCLTVAALGGTTSRELCSLSARKHQNVLWEWSHSWGFRITLNDNLFFLH